MIEHLAPPTADQLAHLAKTHHAAFAPNTRGWTMEEIGRLAANGLLLATPTLAGFAMFSLVLDEAELLTLAVRPSHQRQGLARQLLRTGKQTLISQGISTVFLEVAADNLAAIALYETEGFYQDAVRRGYYSRPNGQVVDALLMKSSLKPV